MDKMLYTDCSEGNTLKCAHKLVQTQKVHSLIFVGLLQGQIWGQSLDYYPIKPAISASLL